MRKVLYVSASLLLALIIGGCDQLLSEIEGNDGSFIGGTEVTLTGRLLNWTGGTGTIYNVHSEPVEINQINPMTGPIRRDGSFSLTLTYPPSWNYYDYPDDCGGDVQVSDPSVGITSLHTQVRDENGNVIGSAQERNTSSTEPAVGNKWLMYVFAENDVRIQGTCHRGIENEADLNLQTGWNAVVVEITGVTNSGNLTTVSAIKTYMATSEAGFNWYFDPW